MVLQKVGATVTTLLFNGSQEAQQEQTDDTTYDIQASAEPMVWTFTGSPYLGSSSDVTVVSIRSGILPAYDLEFSGWNGEGQDFNLNGTDIGSMNPNLDYSDSYPAGTGLNARIQPGDYGEMNYELTITFPDPTPVSFDGITQS